MESGQPVMASRAQLPNSIASPCRILSAAAGVCSTTYFASPGPDLSGLNSLEIGGKGFVSNDQGRTVVDCRAVTSGTATLGNGGAPLAGGAPKMATPVGRNQGNEARSPHVRVHCQRLRATTAKTGRLASSRPRLADDTLRVIRCSNLVSSDPA